MNVRDYPAIDAAVRLHDRAEMYHRRQALLDRAMGRDPEANEQARDDHHRAVQALTREVLIVRRVA